MNWITVTISGKRYEINLDQVNFLKETNGDITVEFTDGYSLAFPKPDGFVYPSEKSETEKPRKAVK